MIDDALTLGSEFPPSTRDEWLELVGAVLEGRSFERTLVTTTTDDLAVQPLYVAGDGPGPDAAGRPGAAPFVRGRTAAVATAGGWDIRQHHHGNDLDALNEAILRDLERGVTSITLGPSGIMSAQDLDRALSGVYLDIAPVALDWGPDAFAGAELLAELWRRRELPAGDVRGELGIDPLGTLARHGWLADPLPGALARLGAVAARTARDWPRARAVLVDATPYADAGASDASEVAAALATGVVYLRAMTAAGLDVDTALEQVVFRFTADADQFATLSKLRAARRCWARVAEVSGASSTAGGMVLHAVTAAAMYAQRDPWVNLLRATLACFAAAAAGADAITVFPFGAAAGQWDELGVRLARNTQLVLGEESHLALVADPAGGSWYVEARTEDVAAAAWRRFQGIEAAGGMAAALADGTIGRQVAETWARRRDGLATRREAVTGVSEFPDIDEEGLPVLGAFEAPAAAPADAAVRIERLPLRRLAEPFEALRDRADHFAAAGDRPSIFLANLGPVAVHTARAAFAKNFFEVAGIRALTNDGFATADEAAQAYRASGATRAVICSSDAVYAERAAETAVALKAAGCGRVYLAGNPGDARASYEAAGVDEFVFVGSDLLDVLGRALG